MLYPERLDLSRYKWLITIDNGEPMYTCPECECRMQKKFYDIAVGTRGLNYCPYCGAKIKGE